MIPNGYTFAKKMQQRSISLITDDPEKMEAQHRLAMRLDQYKLRKRNTHNVQSNWNCLFFSVSDQLFDTIEQFMDIRDNVSIWLKANGDWKLPKSGMPLSSFVQNQTWEEYCNSMAGMNVLLLKSML